MPPNLAVNSLFRCRYAMAPTRQQEEGDLKDRIERQCLAPPYAGLGELAFGIVQPAFAAGHQADEVEHIVQKPAAAPSRRTRTAVRHGVRLQLLQAVGQRIFLLPKQLEAGPQQRRQRGEHQAQKRARE